MRLRVLLIAGAAMIGATAAAAFEPRSSMPDITRQHHQRVTCHNAYDALIGVGKGGGTATAEEMAFGEAYEAAANDKKPCPAVPASLFGRAANHTIKEGETVERLLKYLDANDPSAYFEAGEAAFNQTVPDVSQEDGVNLFKNAAQLGDPNGHYMMARLYLGGQFGTKMDWKGAWPHIQKAAEGGHVDGIFLVAQYAYDGVLGKKDRKTSFEYYKRAAERGHVYATYMAAWQSAEGEGVKKDPKLTYRLARALAEEGEVAGAVLALMALLQQAEAKDSDEAAYWMNVALRDGDEKVKTTITQYRPRVEALYKRLNAPPEYRPRAFKACGTKTVCLVNQFTRVQHCTTNKDYWSDCDG